MATSLVDALVQERDPSVPTEELSPTGQLRRRLLSGNPMSYLDAGEEQKDRALMANVIRQMRDAGFKFKQAKIDHPGGRSGKLTTFQVTNPDHVPTTIAKKRGRPKGAVQTSTPKQGTKSKAKNIALGDTYSVFYVEQTAKGIKIGLSDGNGNKFYAEQAS